MAAPGRGQGIVWSVVSACAWLVVELGECLDAVFVVGHAACLSAAVHGEDGIAHVDSAQGE